MPAAVTAAEAAGRGRRHDPLDSDLGRATSSLSLLFVSRAPGSGTL